jgi:hypothetical protein
MSRKRHTAILPSGVKFLGTLTPKAKVNDITILCRCIIIAILITLGFAATTQAQGDVCHVYVVDSALASSYDNASEKEQARLAKAAQTIFPEFHPTIGEEELTTKTYRFPQSKLIITASVFYTDESLRSIKSADSIMVGIVVSPKKLRDALSATNNAVAEATYTSEPITVKAKKFVRVNNRLYAVGIECHCNEKDDSRKLLLSN